MCQPHGRALQPLQCRGRARTGARFAVFSLSAGVGAGRRTMSVLLLAKLVTVGRIETAAGAGAPVDGALLIVATAGASTSPRLTTAKS